MFDHLIASSPAAERGVLRGLLSAATHLVLVLAAVALTRQALPAAHSTPPVLVMLYAPPLSAVAPPVPRQERTPTVPSAPAWQPSSSAPALSSSVVATLPTVSSLLQGMSRRPAPGADLRILGLQEPTADLAGSFIAATVDEPVAIIAQRAPVYPAALSLAGVSGQVELAYVVDTLGRAEPGSIRTVSSSHPAFEAAARESVLESRYRPARWRGRLVRQLVRQTLSFRLGE
jgi:TonB family protein